MTDKEFNKKFKEKFGDLCYITALPDLVWEGIKNNKVHDYTPEYLTAKQLSNYVRVNFSKEEINGS